MKVQLTRIGHKLRSGISGQKDNITPAVIGAGATIILSPLSIFLGFWLNNVLARPMLSIEHASSGRIVSHPNTLSTDYTLTMQLQQMGIELKAEDLAQTTFATQEKSDQILDKLLQIINDLNERIDYVKKLSPSVLDIQASKYSEEILGSGLQIKILKKMPPNDQEAAISERIKKYLTKIESLTSKVSFIETRIRNERKCEIYTQVLVLNKGGSEGLIKSEAKFKNAKGEQITFIESGSPPSFDTASLNAVPTFIINKEITFLSPSNSVGLAPPRSMTKLWYKSQEPDCDDELRVVVLESHIGNKMTWNVPEEEK